MRACACVPFLLNIFIDMTFFSMSLFTFESLELSADEKLLSPIWHCTTTSWKMLDLFYSQTIFTKFKLVFTNNAIEQEINDFWIRKLVSLQVKIGQIQWRHYRIDRMAEWSDAPDLNVTFQSRLRKFRGPGWKYLGPPKKMKQAFLKTSKNMSNNAVKKIIYS